MDTKYLLHQQIDDGDLIPLDQYMTVVEWETTFKNRQFDPSILTDRTKYYSFVQLDDSTKLWFKFDTKETLNGFK